MTVEQPGTRARAPLGSPAAFPVAVAGVVLAAATVAFALAASPPGRRLEAAVVHALMVAVPAGVAVAVLRRRPGDRFALLLLAAAMLLSITTLAVSDDGVLYSLGRTTVWLVEPMLVYLLLAFPSGRLTAGVDRAVFGAILLVAGLLYLPTILVVAHFPEPAPWTTCDVSCPANAFALTSSEPAIVEDVVRPLREALTVLTFLAVAAILARRLVRSVPLGRRAFAPVLATAAFRPVVLGAYDLARADGQVSPVLRTLAVVYLLTLPLIALGFAAGLVAARLYVATALERLTTRARAGTGTLELRAEMADALEDPAVRTAYWAAGDPGRWVDETGWPVGPLQPEAGRAVTEVHASGRLAAIEHDAMLTLEPGIVHGAATYALAVLENDRLSAEREAQLQELSESRARILSVGDQARRRIERDLHDGAQQRLVALRAHLALESDGLRSDSARIAALLERLGEDVEETIDEVRSIARGIYPSLLADRGLGDALRSAALLAPLRAAVDSDGVGRYEPEVETTVYFACVEALQNAIKHARGASGVWISLSDDGRLRFDVRDDGSGFAPATARSSSATGLTNLRDRVAALGGVLTVESAPGRGTRIAGAVPVRRLDPRSSAEATEASA
jgi:signal transduction histidine kinase